MNLQNFRDIHGIAAIVRRHFDYRTPISLNGTKGDIAECNFPLVYSRVQDRSKLGLNAKGARAAIEQGQRLVELGVTPTLIVCGDDQRNWDGACLTKEAILEKLSTPPEHGLPVFTSPAVTYPHYPFPDWLKIEAKRQGDYMVHAYLAGSGGFECTPEHRDSTGFWSEPPEVFEARVVSAVTAKYPLRTPVLFDLNFEQLTLLYFLHVKGLKRQQIPFEKGAWVPTKGGGIVYSSDFKVAKEFRPDLTIVE